MMNAIDETLQNLGTDYLDLYYVSTRKYYSFPFIYDKSILNVISFHTNGTFSQVRAQLRTKEVALI